jgi:inhibitor of KinA
LAYSGERRATERANSFAPFGCPSLPGLSAQAERRVKRTFHSNKPKNLWSIIRFKVLISPISQLNSQAFIENPKNYTIITTWLKFLNNLIYTTTHTYLFVIFYKHSITNGGHSLNYTLRPLGDHAIVIQLGNSIQQETHESVKAVTHLFENQTPDWLVELIPAFTTVTLYYDPISIIESHRPFQNTLPYPVVCSEIEHMLSHLNTYKKEEARIIDIPVCYGGEFGPDLEDIANHHQLSPEEVIKIHTNGDYLVYMIGFAPGFPYIGGMSSEIATPRRKSPRLKIPAGSVGIAGVQTGVYPIETPGGWQLIGRTPVKLFQPDNDDSPSLLKAGDRIRFTPISLEEYKALEEEQ